MLSKSYSCAYSTRYRLWLHPGNVGDANAPPMRYGECGLEGNIVHVVRGGGEVVIIAVLTLRRVHV